MKKIYVLLLLLAAASASAQTFVFDLRGTQEVPPTTSIASGGCMGTLHATYPRDTLTRLETMALMSDVDLPLAALKMQIASGVNVIVQVARTRGGSRQVTHVTEVAGFDMTTGRYDLNDLFVRSYGGIDASGDVASSLDPTGVLPVFMPTLLAHGIDLPNAMYDAAAHREHEHGRR